jgi:uncharacterized protein YkwD
MTRTPLLAVLAICISLAVPTAAAQAAPANPARAVAKQVNRYRAAHGLRKLRISASLSRSAYRYSVHLMRADYFGHAARIHASSRYHVLGENLAFQWGWRVRHTFPVRAWAHSPGHNAVMLDRRFRYIGVGRAAGRFGRHRATIWTLQVGR